MTIAVGLLCDDGVVLCADTLLSANYRKQGRKIWHRHVGALEVAVAGAGDYVLLKRATTEILSRLEARMSGADVIHGVVEKVLGSIYSDHVDRVPQWQQETYGIDLVIGVKTPNGAALYESSRRAVAPVDGITCVGSGAPVGNYVASTLHSKTLPVLWGQVVAAYLIQQTRAYGQDCGGETNIVVMPVDKPTRDLVPNKIRLLERAGTLIHEAMGRVLVAAADTEARNYKESFDALWKDVNDSRNAVMMEHMNDLFTRPGSMISSRRPEDSPTPQSPKRGRKRQPPSRG